MTPQFEGLDLGIHLRYTRVQNLEYKETQSHGLALALLLCTRYTGGIKELIQNFHSRHISSLSLEKSKNNP